MKYMRDDMKLDPDVGYLVAVRHGESMGNAWEPAYRNPAMNFLTELGEVQAKLAGLKLKKTGITFTHMICSNITRARQTLAVTAHTIGDWKRDFVVDDRFNERIAPHAIHGPNEGESSAETHSARVIDGYRMLVQPALERKENVLLVTHYYTMQALFHHLSKVTGLSLQRMWGRAEHIPNAVPFIIDVSDPFGNAIVLNDETRVPKY